MLDIIIAKYNYWIYIILMMIGFYAMIGKKNLIKKIIGMNIFQTAIILFYISTAYKKGGATLPIIEHGHGEHVSHAIEVSSYLNPLPHVLMLTAIVVMVATLGVALAIVLKMYRRYNTLEEDEILKAIK
ncbi:MAG: NADH-quinone oxidoreductase subunit J [Desulfobacteraceae bacterium 4572_187]|nr:MAG: NADH-quinone oxidoreductase subunit J [Desulfobacteraceae bacterium 4572_187]